jgi:phosphoribosyl 1,2-cyclic phosphodiesterase
VRFEGDRTIAYIPDTRFFPTLYKDFKGDILIINVVRREKSEYDHLSLEEARKIIKEIKPETAILTHFGMTMIRAKPWVLAEKLQEELGINVIAARDGMKFAL